MIRAFASVLVLSLVSGAAVANAACDTSLTLSCSAYYRGDNNLMTELVGAASFTGDACSANLEIVNGSSSVEFYAAQDLDSDVVNYSARAVHSDAQGRKYSKPSVGYASAGMAMNFGFIHLPEPIQFQGSTVRDVLVSCTTLSF